MIARLLALSMIAAGSVSLAQDAAKLPPFELKNRSTFNIKAGTRAPFWPIGWSKDSRPVVTATPAAVKVFQIQPNHFTVSSIMLAHPPLATINGRAFGEGEFLPVAVGGQPVRVVVKAIRDGGVWLDQSGHQIFVPMRRQELQPRAQAETPQQVQEFKINIEPK